MAILKRMKIAIMLPNCVFPGFVPSHQTDDLLHIGSISLLPMGENHETMHCTEMYNC